MFSSQEPACDSFSLHDATVDARNNRLETARRTTVAFKDMRDRMECTRMSNTNTYQASPVGKCALVAILRTRTKSGRSVRRTSTVRTCETSELRALPSRHHPALAPAKVSNGHDTTANRGQKPSRRRKDMSESRFGCTAVKLESNSTTSRSTKDQSRCPVSGPRLLLVHRSAAAESMSSCACLRFLVRGC